MAVETTTNFNGLDISLPSNAETFNDGDDHLRLIKQVIKDVFPGIIGNGLSAPVTATESNLNFLGSVTSNLQAQLNEISNGQLPIGGIIPSSGLISAIPSNFALCDGTNGTPNMTDRFAFATLTEGVIGDVGGTNDQVIESHNHTNIHNHVVSSDTAGVHTHDMVLNEVPNGTIDGVGFYENYASDTAANLLLKTSGTHTHTAAIPTVSITTPSVGVSGVGLNIPPYVKLFFMMRVS